MDPLLPLRHIVVTVNPATAIHHAFRCEFIKPKTDHLILCKGSTIEVYHTTIYDLGTCVLKFSIYGSLITITPWKLPDRPTCSLFILTDNYQYTVVTYEKGVVVTEATGVLNMDNARPNDEPVTCVVDYNTQTMLINAFIGVSQGRKENPYLHGNRCIYGNHGHFNPMIQKAHCSLFSTHEYDMISMALVTMQADTYVAGLFGFKNQMRTIKYMKYSGGKTDIEEEVKYTCTVESSVHMMINVPQPLGGFISIGEDIITYHHPAHNLKKELSINHVPITAYGFIKGSCDECLIGDCQGYLYMLKLENNHNKVTHVSSWVIGQTSTATSIVDLGNDVLFIGSAEADSCFVRIIRGTSEQTRLETIHSSQNIGPVIDFTLFNYPLSGRKTMVCCSGVDKSGSLKILRSGVNFTQTYESNIPLMTKMWTLNLKSSEKHDTIIISGVEDTLVYQSDPSKPGQMVQMTQYSGLKLDEPTLLVALTPKNQLLQITNTRIQVVEVHKKGRMLVEWKAPVNEDILVADFNRTLCTIYYGHDKLACFEILKNGIVKGLCDIILQSVSSMSISHHLDNGTPFDFLIVGDVVTPQLTILKLPTLTVDRIVELPGTAGVTDLLVASFNQKNYLFTSMGDGKVITHTFEEGQDLIPVHQKCVQPAIGGGRLRYVKTEEDEFVFITGSEPTVVSYTNGMFDFSTFNQKDIFDMAAFNDCIILISDSRIMVGETKQNQGLHCQSVALNGEMPLRIEYIATHNLLGLGTTESEKNLSTGEVSHIGRIHLLDARIFKFKDTFKLPDDELVACLVSYTNPDNQDQFLFVGTVVSKEDFPQQEGGRILVFRITEESKLDLIEEVNMSGVVKNMKPCLDSLVASVNGTIHFMEKFDPDAEKGSRVQFSLKFHRNIFIISMDVLDDLILVGDMMQSSAVVKVNKQDKSMAYYSKDIDTIWVTASKFIDKSVCMSADDRLNLFSMMTVPAPREENNRWDQLRVYGGFHVGSIINAIKEGSLLSGFTDHDRLGDGKKIHNPYTPLTFVTTTGLIGAVNTISESDYQILRYIEEVVIEKLPNIGHLNHARWRKCSTASLKEKDYTSFVDGDILKAFVNMTKKQQENIIHGEEQFKQYSPEYVLKAIRRFIF
ncbi:CPSF A subunit region-domain-containing protein [Pilobolus umbonatus]|nr:CPSF A subunit region-domain-containing protein [Pilobolus umbonatus]